MLGRMAPPPKGRSISSHSRARGIAGKKNDRATVMADMTEDASPATKLRDVRVISLVGAAHFMSHVYILMLPPLFLYARAEYGVSYEQLAYAMAAFGFFSATLQTPAGFIVDRFGSSTLLVAGL